jgi:SPP1 family predicted phage head-tail adaptor
MTYRLTKRVTINRPQKQSDFAFNANEADKVCDAWAEIAPLLAFERTQAEQVTPGSTHRIIIRWPGVEIDAGMYVLADTARYEIQGVTDLGGEGQYLELMSTRKTAAAGTVTTR